MEEENLAMLLAGRNMVKNWTEFLAYWGVITEATAQKTWNASTPYIEKVTTDIVEKFSKKLDTNSDDIWHALLDPYKDSGLLNQAQVNSLMSARKATPPLNFIMFIVIAYQLLVTHYSALLAPAQEVLMQKALAEQRPTLPQTQQAIQAAFIAPEKTAEVREYLSRYGYSEKVIDLMFLSQYKLYDEQTIMMVYLRGIIDENKMFERMRELGYTDTRTKEIVQTWSLIPGPQDLLTMVAHEAFEPDSIAKMGLDEEFPAEQAEWLTKQGLSPYWQMKYWIAHWEQPSIQMGYEMLQRGIINREDLEFLFRTVEIPRYWRDKLLAIAYTPYTRVDARRMHKLGVLTDAELVVAYKDIGYDQAHAEKMAEFTRKANMAAEKDLSKTEVMTGYGNSLITKTQCHEFLMRLGYDTDESDYIIAAADFKAGKATAALLQSTIETQYKNLLIDKAEARRQLDALGLPGAQTAALLSKWEASLVKSPSLPTATELSNFLIAGIINTNTYHAEMLKHGYGSLYADWFERLAKSKFKSSTTVVAGGTE
jgi:hypothetical protein